MKRRHKIMYRSKRRKGRELFRCFPRQSESASASEILAEFICPAGCRSVAAPGYQRGVSVFVSIDISDRNKRT